MFKSTWSFLRATYSEFSNDKATRLAAALAYYAIFAIAPLLVIAISIAGIVLGEKAAQGQLLSPIRSVVGESGASVIDSMIAGARNTSSGIIATILSFALLLFGASAFFSSLKYTLDVVWEVEPKKDRGVMGAIKDRLFAVLLVLSTGILLIAFMVGSSVLWSLTTYFRNLLPLPPVFWQIVVNFIAPVVVLTMVFGLILKVVPDVKITWRDVWIGAFVTALLFTVGQFLLGLYLGRSSYSSTYGLAGAVLLVLIWIYYSAQIFLLGAEMTQVYARRYGKTIEPSDNAVSLRKDFPQQRDQEKRKAA